MCVCVFVCVRVCVCVCVCVPKCIQLSETMHLLRGIELYMCVRACVCTCMCVCVCVCVDGKCVGTEVTCQRERRRELAIVDMM